jgi:hypothetical protein
MHLDATLAYSKIIILILVSCGTCFAQKDSLNHRLFNAMLQCDSANTALLNENTRLRGELNAKNAILITFQETSSTKDALLYNEKDNLRRDLDFEKQARQKESESYTKYLVIGFSIPILVLTILLLHK